MCEMGCRDGPGALFDLRAEGVGYLRSLRYNIRCAHEFRGPHIEGTIAERFALKTFPIFVWIADWHILKGFLEPSVLFLGMRLDEKRHPSLKADRCKARNVWSLTVSFLNEIMLTTKVSIHPGD